MFYFSFTSWNVGRYDEIGFEKDVKVIDLGADFRLDDSEIYEKWRTK